jgi:ribosomal protein S18 acetylase RimI-like enzyme
MSELRFERATPSGPEILLDDWRRIHNLIIPTAPLSGADVRARAGRNRLVVAYLDAVAVGCSTVRPPVGDPPAATVIARILPGYRRRGFGEQLYRRAVTTALELGAHEIDTVVLASNEEGLRFAERHGFAETERYVLPGDTIAFVDLRLARDAGRPDPRARPDSGGTGGE